MHGAWGNAKVTVHKGIIGLHHGNINNNLGGGGHFVFGFGKMKIKFLFCFGFDI